MERKTIINSNDNGDITITCNICGNTINIEDHECNKCGQINYYASSNKKESSKQSYNNNSFSQSKTIDTGKVKLAIASFVLSLIGLICIGNFMSILGIVFGSIFLATSSQEKRKLAIAGISLGILGIVLMIFAHIFHFSFWHWFWRFR